MWSVARRLAVFGATAAGVYVFLVLCSVAAVISEGGGVSCYEDCTPTQNWLDHSAPWPMVAAIAFSLLAGLTAAWPFRDDESEEAHDARPPGGTVD
jgi:hypothetical protein